MNPEGNSRNPAGRILSAAVCALACVYFNQSGALSLLSLLPIGIAAVMFSSLTCWYAVSYSILMYAGFLVIFRSQDSFSIIDILLQTGVFSFLPLLFAWIMAPPVKGPGFLRVRTSFRLVFSSVILLAIHLPLMYDLFQQKDFYQSLLADIEAALSMIPIEEMGSDAVAQSLIQNFFTPEHMVNSVVFFGLRGGGIVSILLFFFLSRQLSFSLARMFRRTDPAPGLALFKIKSSFIWVFSFSILILLVSFLMKLEILEIIAWNIFIICGIVYAAQGMGIVMFFLNRPGGRPRGFRVLLNLLFVIMIFRLNLMVYFLAVLAVLGILENWVPFRAPKPNKPSSTPEM